MAGICNQLENLPGDPGERVEVLRLVAYTLENLWENDPKGMNLEYTTQIVGNVAREESNRLSLGESGLVDLMCSIVSAPDVGTGLLTQCLRIIGNSSADQDENRRRVVDSGCLPRIISLLGNESIRPFSIPVLFNVCVDYEPAQKAIYQAGINPELINILSGPAFENADMLMTYIGKLLGFVGALEPDPDLVHPDTFTVLLGLATNPATTVEDYITFASAALSYLAHDKFQQTFLRQSGAIILILQAFARACEGFSESQLSDEEQAALKQVQVAFTATMADLSAQPLFTLLCALDGLEVQILQRWISTPYIPLRSGACLTIGNIARSHEICTYLVQKSAIHTQLLTILSDPKIIDAGLLHSALSFLKNLAIPPLNRPILGAAGLLDMHVLPRIWDLDTQHQVQFDAVSLARLLVVGCPENVGRICSPISESELNTRSKLHILMDINKRSDQEPTVMETARAITAVCRVLHSNPLLPPSKAPATKETTIQLPSLESFYANHSTITEPMLSLARQTKFPALRSEMLLVFALMARTADGAVVIARALHKSETATLITELATSGKIPVQAEAKSKEMNLLNFDQEKSTSQHQNGDGDKENGKEAENQTPQTNEHKPDDAQQHKTKTKPPTPETGKRHHRQNQNPNHPNSNSIKPNTTATAPNVDRENTLVLIAELLRLCPDALPPTLKLTFEDLLRQGGKRLSSHERNGNEDEGKVL
ncbi:armadillo-type protein [Xylaria sp. CBS 124048]|nr:armadillo-type protein [Xylaria sp. CBS 124048]